MKPLFLICLCFYSVCSHAGQLDTSKIIGHPRLLLLEGQESKVLQQVNSSDAWSNYHASILKESDAIITLPAVERTMIGRRLLQVSREALRRIFYLSYSWRLTKKKAYLERCEKELLAVAEFTDWNPSHFLDVAEMTMAVSIGYDWMYKELTDASRKTIREAIIEKGLKPSLDSQYNGWLRGSNNWNQVCNAGISFGALAVYEDQPVLSRQLLERALKSILIPMKHYEPDGNYMEGYSYWGYGTSFNVFFIDALEKIFGTDFNLTSQPGFLQTAAFYENIVSQSGRPFNYADCGGPEGLQPAMFWFSGKAKDPSLLYMEKQYLLGSAYDVKSSRLLPAAILWADGVSLDAIKAPLARVWAAQKDNQVAVMRTSWTQNSGIYVGFKGGTPSTSHAHMDGGSFVMDADGVRWSSDLGMQQYNSLESVGLNIWNMAQNSQRWEVFRYSNLSHSTLTINGHLQNVKGDAKLLKVVDDSLNTRSVMDLSSLYKEDLAGAQRGIAIINRTYVAVRDEIETGDKECVIRWAMLTPAKVTSISENQAVLGSNKKNLVLSVTGIPGVQLKTWSTDPPRSYDAPNKGTVLVGFEIKVPAHTKIAFNVALVPGTHTSAAGREEQRPLNEW